MPGPQPKPAARRQRPHQGEQPRTDLALLPSVTVVPDPPEGLSERWISEWGEFFRSEVGKLATRESWPALGRLFELRAERDTLRAECREERFIVGSTKQPVLNPLHARLDKVEGQILSLEDRFGLHPKGRLVLGAAMADTARSLEDLNAKYRKQKESPRRQAAVDLATS